MIFFGRKYLPVAEPSSVKCLMEFLIQNSKPIQHVVNVYIVFSSKKVGLLDPATSDGRVIFLLPWEGKTIAGTTDQKCDLTFSPEATEKEIQFILDEIKNYLNPDVHGMNFFWP